MKSILVIIFHFSFFTINSYSQSVGIGTTNPSDALHIVGATNDDPLRVQVGTATKLRVLKNGGTTIGANNTSGTPADGLYVQGNTGLGIGNPTDKLAINGDVNITGEIKANGLAGQTGQVLQANGSGGMSWANMPSNVSTNGNGTWGDCNLTAITDFQPMGKTNGIQGEKFGRSVAISGHYAIVGSPDHSEPNVSNCGNATIYKLNTTTNLWEIDDIILNPGFQENDFFGFSVEIDNDYVIVGAHGDDDATFFSSGSATIFKRNPSTNKWDVQSKLVNPNQASGDNFGNSVSISGDYAVVGSYLDSENAKSYTGSATFFKRNPTTQVWESQGKIINQNNSAYDHFGNSVAISGDLAIIGAYNDTELSVSGVVLSSTGSASIYKRNNSTLVWELQTKLTNINAAVEDQFGRSVAIYNNYAVVGSNNDNEKGKTAAGSASIFKRNLTTGIWQPVQKLTNLNANDYDDFGGSVSINDDYIAVGAAGDNFQGMDNNGSVSIYKRYESVWHRIQKFTHPNSDTSDQFGNAVALDSSLRFLVGADNFNLAAGIVFFGKIN